MVSEKWQLNTSRRIIKRKCFETFSWFYYEYDGKIGRKKVASETKKIAKSWNIKKYTQRILVHIFVLRHLIDVASKRVKKEFRWHNERNKKAVKVCSIPPHSMRINGGNWQKEILFFFATKLQEAAGVGWGKSLSRILGVFYSRVAKLLIYEFFVVSFVSSMDP